MKRVIVLIFFLVSFSIFAKAGEWTEVQSVVLPENTILNYSFKEDGSVKYFIIVEGITVSISRNNAQKFIRGECKLELVKWYNQINHKYKYSIRQYKDQNGKKNIDLSKIQFNHG